MNRLFTTTNIRYWTDGYATYWTVDSYDCPPGDRLTFCANTYATFRGDRIGEHQVMGPARAPDPAQGAKAMRAWFVREFGKWEGATDKVSVRRVKNIKELA